MRFNYPISSQEFLDMVDNIYESQLFILGTSGVTGRYSGVYNNIEASGITIFASGYNTFENLSPLFGKSEYINKHSHK